jgi:hypothetical protein
MKNASTMYWHLKFDLKKIMLEAQQQELLQEQV